jgi:hypothetical protein
MSIKQGGMIAPIFMSLISAALFMPSLAYAASTSISAMRSPPRYLTIRTRFRSFHLMQASDSMR